MGLAHKQLSGVDLIVHSINVERAVPVETHKQHEKVEFERLHLTVFPYLRKQRDVIFIRQFFNIAELLRCQCHFFVHI